MDHRRPPVEIRIETYERLPPVATGDTPVVTGGLRWVSSTGDTFLLALCIYALPKVVLIVFKHVKLIVTRALKKPPFRDRPWMDPCAS